MSFFSDLKKYNGYAIYTAKAMLESEVTTSYLDWIWWVLEPFMTMIVYVVIFGVVFKAAEPDFPLFVFSGIMIWNFFQRLVSVATSIVRANRAIVTKVYVPKHILLLSEMYRNIYKLIFELMIIVVMMFVYRVSFSVHVILTIPYLMSFFVFTYSISLVFTHYGVFVNDLAYAISILLRFLMYFSGVFYSIENRITGQVGIWLQRLNPIAFYVASFRNALLYGRMASIPWLLVWTAVAVVIGMFGVHLIYRYEDGYAKII